MQIKLMSYINKYLERNANKFARYVGIGCRYKKSHSVPFFFFVFVGITNKKVIMKVE